MVIVCRIYASIAAFVGGFFLLLFFKAASKAAEDAAQLNTYGESFGALAGSSLAHGLLLVGTAVLAFGLAELLERAPR